MTKLFVIVLILAVAAETVTAKAKCDGTKLSECILNLTPVVLSHLRDFEKTNEAQYCRDVEMNRDCKDAMENCHDEMPLFAPIYAYVNMLCSDNKEVYTANAQCMKDHKSKFEKCKIEVHKEDDLLKVVCSEIDRLQCEAAVTKKECENGEALGQAIEKQISNLRTECKAYSSGCSVVFVHHFWLLTIVLLGFFLKSKF